MIQTGIQARVALEHYQHSNGVNEALPDAIDAVDNVIYVFSQSTAVRTFQYQKK